MQRHIVDIPKFLEVFDEIKDGRKQIRISRDYLHRMLTALKSDMTRDEVIILRARIDGTPFSVISQSKEILNPDGKCYSRQRIAQMEQEAIAKILDLQGKKKHKQQLNEIADYTQTVHDIYDNPPRDDFDILEGPSDEELQEIEQGHFNLKK
jgi:pyocin large subunit-like protein